MPVPDARVRRFAALYAGYTKAYATFDPGHVERGKVKGRYVTVREALTERAWRGHLEGTAGLVVIPLRDDDRTVTFGAIDIDVPNIDLRALDTKVKERNLPLVVCRSKSRGAHLYLFLEEPTDAEAVYETLASWAALLGHGGAEIFPKQWSRVGETDVGNGINLPYFGDSDRVGILEGEELDLEAFLDLAEVTRTKLKPPATDDLLDDPEATAFPEGPPCLQALEQLGGFPEGTRNEGMYAVAVYLRKRHGDVDAVQTAITTYDATLCHPPLGLKELTTVVRSVSKKGYEYKCNLPPINAHCRRRHCRARRFGVGDPGSGGGRTGWPTLESLTMYLGDPVRFVLQVDGHRIGYLSEEDLFVQRALQRRLSVELLTLPPTLPGPRFEAMLREVIARADRVPAEETATDKARFEHRFHEYVTQRARAEVPAELEQGLPYWVDGVVQFQLQGLFTHLEHARLRYTQTQVCLWLREFGAKPGKGYNLGNKRFLRCWELPAPVEDEGRDPPSFKPSTEEKPF